MAAPDKARALRLIRKMGLARPRELASYGISRAQLARLVSDGFVVR